jgi:site-specific DNA-methyltransferase (adenine-specific)
MEHDLPNGIYIKDCRNMSEIEDETVGLVVTSPPYNVSKEYEKGQTFEKWYEMMTDVLTECNRVMKRGARACINVASIGRHPYRPLYYYIIDIAFKIGWKMRGTIIWTKGGSGPKSAWGSFGMASNPTLRDSHEFILVFYKKDENYEKGETGISGEEFIEFSRAEWKFQPARAQKIGHPAPFPDELPRRCILFYSNIGDIVLDPFGGSCTSFKVAKILDREAWEKVKWINEKYPDFAKLSSRQLQKIIKRERIPLTQKMNSRLYLMKRIADARKQRKRISKFGIKILRSHNTENPPKN